MNKKVAILNLILLIIFLIIQGTLSKFINPTLRIGLYICLPILLLFFISDLRSSNKNNRVSLLFIIPIICVIIGYSGKFSPVYTKTLAKQNSRTTSFIPKENNNENNNLNEIVENNKNSENSKEVISVNDDNYIDTLNMIYENVDNYIGATIKIEGCVFRNDYGMENNQFGAGKYYMYCCAADMSLAGFLFQYGNFNDIESGKWYSFEAVVNKHKASDQYYGEYIEPILIVKNFNEISEPQNTIVYQSF